MRRAPSSEALLNEEKGGPWGRTGGGGKGPGGWGGGSGGSGGGSGGEGPRNPWGAPGAPRRRPAGVGNVASLDDFLKKSRAQFGGGLPSGNKRKIWIYAGVALLALWLVLTSFHRVGPQERGVVTFVGNYARTLGPGLHMTWPAPIERFQKLDVDNVRTVLVPSGGTGENLVLTGDQNIVDLAYSVRWSIKNPEQYLFQIEFPTGDGGQPDPEQTIRDVAESAMRAAVANFTLDDAIGAQRSQIEARVAEIMQQVLDSYRAGIRIQGIAIRQADPPEAVNEAFKEVVSAQQKAQSATNQARSYASQVTARAQGDAAQFDRVYEEYRQAPDVTRRRMYYETMEQVLSKVDKTVVEAPGVTPYLPLPEVRGRQATPTPQAGRDTATANGSASSGSGGR